MHPNIPQLCVPARRYSANIWRQTFLRISLLTFYDVGREELLKWNLIPSRWDRTAMYNGPSYHTVRYNTTLHTILQVYSKTSNKFQLTKDDRDTECLLLVFSRRWSYTILSVFVSVCLFLPLSLSPSPSPISTSFSEKYFFYWIKCIWNYRAGNGGHSTASLMC